MYWLRYPILVLSLIPFTFADSAVQTDWSGGPGVLGPVIDWGDQFCLDTGVGWSGSTGSVVLQMMFAKHTLDGDFDGARSVYSEDIDGDGDMDILGAARYDNSITWWKNTDGFGTLWTEYTVDGDFFGAYCVYSEDIDGDGDMDILGAGSVNDDITWWRNIDGSGTSWTKFTVDLDFNGAFSVYSEDIDGDGDMDIIGAAWIDDDITWWENEDGSGTSWLEHAVNGNFDGATSVYAEDVDGDGDMDILGTARYDNHITWWENINGSGTSWVEHTVDGGFVGAWSVYSEDVDGDGDMDIIGAAYFGDEIAWWENEDGSGTSWTGNTVDGNFSRAFSVYSEDIDGDGDRDILGASEWDDHITWWENEDASGTSWAEHTVDGNFDGASSVYSADINSDGDMDILGAAAYADDITWWDHTGYLPGGSLESSILDTEEDPDWDYLEWNSQTPPGTDVSFQVRSSTDPDIGSMGAWSDTLFSPCSLVGILDNGDRYVQYKAILETSDPYTTSTLNDITISWDPVSIGETTEPIPPGIALLPITPNPVAGSPVIRFGLPEPASVELSIFDLSGRLVNETRGEEYSTGYHDVLLGELSPGVYFCRMISGDFVAAQCFVVIK